MNIKVFISIILLGAFSLVLAHNIIPHHHHDEVAAINHHEHHHDNHDNQDNHGLLDLFSHLNHNYISDYSVAGSVQPIAEKTQKIVSCFNDENSESLFVNPFFSGKYRFRIFEVGIRSSFCTIDFSRRGPPSFLS